MEKAKSVNELLCEVNAFLRDANPGFLFSSDIYTALCNFADAVSQQQEIIDSLQERARVKVSGEVSYDNVNITTATPITSEQIKDFEGLLSEASLTEAPRKTKHLARYYHNGAHAGNIYYEIELWGMNSPAREAAIKRLLDEFISGLQADWQGL